MERISRDEMFCIIAMIVSLRATCERAKIGAVLVKENRIVSIGYNGSPSGSPHCTEAGCLIDERGGCKRTVHAEANVIAFAAKNGIETDGTTLYCTVSPCIDCAKLLINSGVKRLVYLEGYRDTSGIELLMNCGVEVCRKSVQGVDYIKLLSL